MKPIQLALALLAAVAAARAEDITLTDGRTFTDAKIASQTPTHVTIRHGGGLQQVSKKLLPAALAEKYPVDEAAAEAARKKDAMLKEQQRQAAIQREQKQREELALREKQQQEAYRQDFEKSHAAMKAAADSYAIVAGQFIIERSNGRDVGMTGMRVYFCTPEQWNAYQERRRQQFETDYMKHRSEIFAQGYDVNGESVASFNLWLAYRRWHRSTYNELPEHFASTETGFEGKFSLHVSQRPFVMFARSERAISEGMDYFVWVEDSNSFQPGVLKSLSRGNSKRDEVWARMPSSSQERWSTR